jgi:hypothetical protein
MDTICVGEGHGSWWSRVGAGKGTGHGGARLAQRRAQVVVEQGQHRGGAWPKGLPWGRSTAGGGVGEEHADAKHPKVPYVSVVEAGE